LQLRRAKDTPLYLHYSLEVIPMPLGEYEQYLQPKRVLLKMNWPIQGVEAKNGNVWIKLGI